MRHLKMVDYTESSHGMPTMKLRLVDYPGSPEPATKTDLDNHTQIIREIIEEHTRETVASSEDLKKALKDTIVELARTRKELASTREELVSTRELIEMRRAHKTTFSIGLVIGIITLIIGLFGSNLLYSILGLGILLTSGTAMYEAHKNDW